MASRIWRDVQTAKRARKIISGSCAPNGVTKPLSVKGGGVYTAERDPAGVFTVYLTDAYAEVESATFSLQLAVATDRFMRVSAIANVTLDGRERTAVQAHVIDGANVLQDIAADANNRIHFTLVLRNN